VNPLALAGMLLATHVNDMWYALPLIVAVSLIYSATRHEQMRDIINGALRTGIWISGFMLALFLILFLMSSRV
jgi:uncharacterized membrane protein